jgi:uncharacterized cupredoxin-like copper-binding protein
VKARTTIFFSTAILLLLSAGTNSSTAQPTTPTKSPTTQESPGRTNSKVTKIEVTEKEMEIKLSSATAPAGPIEFVVTNQGQRPHEMEIIKTDLPFDKLPMKNGRLDTEKAGKEIAEIEADELKSGETKTLRVNLTPGTYLIECNLPRHFKAGMRALLTVK